MAQLPSSSTGVRLTDNLREPWQLVARNGAGLLAIGLSMPVLVSQLWVWSFSLLQLGPDTWQGPFAAIRWVHLFVQLFTVVGVVRVAQAPVITPLRRWVTVLLVVWPFVLNAMGAIIVTFNPLGGAGLSLPLSMAGCVGELAVILMLRHLDGSLRQDHRPTALWSLLFVLQILITTLVLLSSTLSIVAFGAVLNLLSMAAAVLMVVALVQLRKRLR